MNIFFKNHLMKPIFELVNSTILDEVFPRVNDKQDEAAVQRALIKGLSFYTTTTILNTWDQNQKYNHDAHFVDWLIVAFTSGWAQCFEDVEHLPEISGEFMVSHIASDFGEHLAYEFSELVKEENRGGAKL